MNENNKIRILFLNPKAVKSSVLKIWLKNAFNLVLKNPQPWMFFNFVFLTFNLLIAGIFSTLAFSVSSGSAAVFFSQLVMTTANCLTLLGAYKLVNALIYNKTFKAKDFFMVYNYNKNHNFQFTILLFLIIEIILSMYLNNIFPEINAKVNEFLNKTPTNRESLEYIARYFTVLFGIKTIIFFFTAPILPLISLYEWNNNKVEYKTIIKNTFLALKRNIFVLLNLLLALFFLFFSSCTLLITVLSAMPMLLLALFAVLLIFFFPFSLSCIFLAVKDIFME